MRKDDKASVSLMKIIIITVTLLLVFGIGAVMASNMNATNVKIIFANDYELNIMTTKTKVADILAERHIALLENEATTPGLNENFGEDKTIYITKVENMPNLDEADEAKPLKMEDIINSYDTVVEKIITLEVEIPFETITKDITKSNSQDTKVIQEGKNGLKEVTYKITYKDDIEVDRLELEEKIIRKPVNKIVQVKQNTTSRSGNDRMASTNPAETETNISLAKKVSTIEPKVVKLNASAYTASTCGKSPADSKYGITASGSKAQAWYTVAAGKGYAIGTVMYIPYFKDAPNKGWFVVQDRGGAISNSKVDIYMDTYSECKEFGRRNLECYIYEL